MNFSPPDGTHINADVPQDIVTRNTFEEKSIIIIHGPLVWSICEEEEHMEEEVNTPDEDGESNVWLQETAVDTHKLTFLTKPDQATLKEQDDSGMG